MPHTVEAGWPSIKIDGEWRPPGKGPHDDVEVRVAYSFLHAPALARFLSGVDMDAMWLMAEEGGWRLTIKGKRGERPVVAYFHATSFRNVVTLAATSLDTDRAKWWPDDNPIT